MVGSWLFMVGSWLVESEQVVLLRSFGWVWFQRQAFSTWSTWSISVRFVWFRLWVILF